MSRDAFARQHASSASGAGRRNGFALAIALLATLLIAALLAALFFAVNEETRTGVAVASRDRALTLAETALEAGLANLEADRPGSQVGTVATRSVYVNGRSAVVHLTRLDSNLVWLVVVVADGGSGRAPPRRIGALASESSVSADSISTVRATRRGWSELF